LGGGARNINIEKPMWFDERSPQRAADSHESGFRTLENIGAGSGRELISISTGCHGI
jgi:hypothetical protein